MQKINVLAEAVSLVANFAASPELDDDFFDHLQDFASTLEAFGEEEYIRGQNDEAKRAKREIVTFPLTTATYPTTG
jgi:hypothetical protein